MIPYFNSRIMDHVKRGDRVLVAAHGNSLRAIIMALDDLTPEDVPLLELATGVPIVYEISPNGEVQNKKILIS